MCIAEAMGCAMDGLQTLDIALFSAGTFAAAFVTGLAGFAFGIIAAAVWLHFLVRAHLAVCARQCNRGTARRRVATKGSRRADADGRRRAADRLCALQLVPP